MKDLAYEDLETEAVAEREEHERYEAECAQPFEPTPTKAQNVQAHAELTLECMRNDGESTFNQRLLCRMIIDLAKAIDD